MKNIFFFNVINNCNENKPLKSKKETHSQSFGQTDKQTKKRKAKTDIQIERQME